MNTGKIGQLALAQKIGFAALFIILRHPIQLNGSQNWERLWLHKFHSSFSLAKCSWTNIDDYALFLTRADQSTTDRPHTLWVLVGGTIILQCGLSQPSEHPDRHHRLNFTAFMARGNFIRSIPAVLSRYDGPIPFSLMLRNVVSATFTSAQTKQNWPPLVFSRSSL